MRTCAERGFRPFDRGQAAFALWQLTGDAGALLDIVAASLTAEGEGHEPYLLALLPQLGPAARPLLPGLRRHVREQPQRLRSNTSIAGVLYQLDGDHDEILPILAAALTHRQPPEQAVALAGALGERAVSLLPLLRDLQGTDIGWLKVQVIDVRHRLGDVGVEEVVAAVLPAPAGFEYWHHAAARAAVDLVVRLEATQAVERLEAYLATDKRIRFGGQDDLVRDDERLQARLRTAIGALRPAPAPVRTAGGPVRP
ncbi:hypothetical protein OHA72_48800 [Dactylosporangium sp. NBC_01737]|uniref:hypothetical protein n=1 Tax=Dactylosporangium sp. NBC_01737 TaxID=2975959 RepID=UPI002E110938|nr:hypothetical protein OHA72_48800 [Dactylosporangium sp. NBC_01737]